MTHNFSNITKDLECKLCNYKWLSKFKRPNPRFITCPNCRGQVELRESKLN